MSTKINRIRLMRRRPSWKMMIGEVMFYSAQLAESIVGLVSLGYVRLDISLDVQIKMSRWVGKGRW